MKKIENIFFRVPMTVGAHFYFYDRANKLYYYMHGKDESCNLIGWNSTISKMRNFDNF